MARCARRTAGKARAVTATASPAVESIRDRVRDAAARRTPLRIVGAGTWLDAGRPAACEDTVSLAAHAGIVDYVPGDLTLTARAGTTLAEIRDATARHGQWLALDPHGSDDGTLGATIATASAGPLAANYGTPRDLTLGVEFVTGRGATVRGGGRVVKNVAGFDLTRLVTGSWGTLGVITEATVRLHARPERDVSLGIATHAARNELVRIRAALRRWPFVPVAFEIVNDALGHRLGVGGGAVLARLAGNAESLAAQRRALGELGSVIEIDPTVWTRLRAADAGAPAVIRLSRPSAEIDATWTDAGTIAAPNPGSLVHATAARGIVRCIIQSAADDRLASALAPVASRIVAERLPERLWALAPFRRKADPLESRVRAAFDPYDILNRGVMGDGPA